MRACSSTADTRSQRLGLLTFPEYSPRRKPRCVRQALDRGSVPAALPSNRFIAGSSGPIRFWRTAVLKLIRISTSFRLGTGCRGGHLMHRVRALLLLLLVAPVTAFAQNGPPQVIPANQRDVSPPLRTIPPAARHVGNLEAEPVRQFRRGGTLSDRTRRCSGHDRRRASRPPRRSETSTASDRGSAGPQGTFSVNSAPPDNNGAVGRDPVRRDRQHRLRGVRQDDRQPDLRSGARSTRCGQGIRRRLRVEQRWRPDGRLRPHRRPVDHLAVLGLERRPSSSASPCRSNGDPTGSYYRYSFSYGTRISRTTRRWASGQTRTTRPTTCSTPAGTAFLGAKVCAFDRARMLTGAAATQVCFSTSHRYGGLLPADVDGLTLPPAGAPNPLIALGATSTTLALWRFHVDFTTPAQSTFTGPTAIPVPSYAEALRGRDVHSPERRRPAWTRLSDRLDVSRGVPELRRSRVARRQPRGDRWQSAWACGGTSCAACRPRRRCSRRRRTRRTRRIAGWAALAMDKEGNIALGYSASSSAIKPQIRFTGRLAGDAARTDDANRGRRSSRAPARSVDPDALGRLLVDVDRSADDCTFWYTNQYLPTTAPSTGGRASHRSGCVGAPQRTSR